MKSLYESLLDIDDIIKDNTEIFKESFKHWLIKVGCTIHKYAEKDFGNYCDLNSDRQIDWYSSIDIDKYSKLPVKINSCLTWITRGDTSNLYNNPNDSKLLPNIVSNYVRIWNENAKIDWNVTTPEVFVGPKNSFKNFNITLLPIKNSFSVNKLDLRNINTMKDFNGLTVKRDKSNKGNTQLILNKSSIATSIINDCKIAKKNKEPLLDTIKRHLDLDELDKRIEGLEYISIKYSNIENYLTSYVSHRNVHLGDLILYRPKKSDWQVVGKI